MDSVMADEKFEVGDTVQLKSGGPHMTVVTAAEYQRKRLVQCTWFVHGDKRAVATFSAESLR